MQKITITSDFHTHTTYSHGTGSVLDNALVAQEKGLDFMAITDHGINHPFVGVPRRKFPKIRQDIENVQKQIEHTQILFGIESNIIGVDGEIDLKPADISQLDIVLAGFHLTSFPSKFSNYFKLSWNGVSHALGVSSKSQIERNTRAYLNAIKQNPIDILTHPGFRLDIDVKEVAKACADYGTLMELSSRHATPGEDVIEDLLSTDVMFVVNSDAHKPENVGKWDFAIQLIEKYNIPPDRIANCNHKLPTFRSKR